MKISAIQFRPVPGDVPANILKHLVLIDIAVSEGAGLIFFPELSLTGYEPKLAASLGFVLSDSRLDVFQEQSDASNTIIGVGLPLKVAPAVDQVQIGMAWFTPGSDRSTYAKQQLHLSEMPFFVPGEGQIVLEAAGTKLAPAICYESLQSNHAEHAARLGANVYLASVAKPAGALAKAIQHYPGIAREHKMHVIMSGSIGPSDDFMSVGQSAAWNDRGKLLVQMDSESEGMVILDTLTGEASVRTYAGTTH